MKKNKKTLAVVLSLLVAGGLAVGINKSKKDPIERMSYSDYTELVENNGIDIIYYSGASEYMVVGLTSEETKNLTEEEKEKYEYDKSDLRYVLYPSGENFKKDLLEQGIIVKEARADFAEFMSNYGDILLYGALFFAVIIAFNKASIASEKGYAEKASPKDLNVKFDDVIGHEEIKGDLQLLVKQLKSGTSAKDLSNGVLFEGSAGTGKTMLAKAIANEAGVNFISVNSSNLVEMYVGIGARRVRKAFKQAKENTPCVLFFDEIDAVGAKRGSQRSNRENDNTINALLTELDGFTEKGNILVIGATNRADNLDEALLRSGRFDRKIKIDVPKKWETRKELFDHYFKDKIDSNVNTELLAKQTVGFSGADIACISREAKLIAFREDKEKIEHKFIEEAIDKMIFKGNRSDSKQHQEDIKYTAYHEAGHAVMTYLLGKEISRISILGMTSGVGGAVFQTDNERLFETKEEIENQIMIAYAGRSAEEIKFGSNKISQGASNDISQATKLLLSYVTKLGFDKKTGLVDVEILSNAFLSQNNTTTERISEISNELYSGTMELLSANFAKVELLAEVLIVSKTMSGDEVVQLFKENIKKIEESDYDLLNPFKKIDTTISKETYWNDDTEEEI